MAIVSLLVISQARAMVRPVLLNLYPERQVFIISSFGSLVRSRHRHLCWQPAMPSASFSSKWRDKIDLVAAEAASLSVCAAMGSENCWGNHFGSSFVTRSRIGRKFEYGLEEVD